MKRHRISIFLLTVVVPGLALEIGTTGQNRLTVPSYTLLSPAYSDVRYTDSSIVLVVPRQGFRQNVENTSNLSRSKRQAYFPNTRCATYPNCRAPVNPFQNAGPLLGYLTRGRRPTRPEAAPSRNRNRASLRGGSRPVVGRRGGVRGLGRGGGERVQGGEQGIQPGGPRGESVRGGGGSRGSVRGDGRSRGSVGGSRGGGRFRGSGGGSRGGGGGRGVSSAGRGVRVG